MEVFKFFFRFGWVAFGGPAAHIALMEEELVAKRKWLDEQTFLDYMGMTNLIPGPNSTEMTMHVGFHRNGVNGLFQAGIGFIFPAVFITLLVAIGYDSIKEVEFLLPIIEGIKAAVLSFIAAAIFKLGKKSAKSNLLIGFGILALILAGFGYNEILIILGMGLLAMLVSTGIGSLQSIGIIPLMAVVSTDANFIKIFLIFLKIGAVLFGSGYVLFAYLDGELINGLGWLTHDDLVEAVAVGQMTPGPVLSTATFIGYQVGGIGGAIAATLGIFIPSFLFVWLLNPIVHRMRSSVQLRSFLNAVNIAAVAVMIFVTFKMGESILTDWPPVLVTLITTFLYFYNKKISPFVIILIGAILGWFFSLI